MRVGGSGLTLDGGDASRRWGAAPFDTGICLDRYVPLVSMTFSEQLVEALGCINHPRLRCAEGNLSSKEQANLLRAFEIHLYHKKTERTIRNLSHLRTHSRKHLRGLVRIFEKSSHERVRILFLNHLNSQIRSAQSKLFDVRFCRLLSRRTR